MNQISEDHLAYLSGRIRRGSSVLFTGAGFSLGAKNHDGEELPSTGELKALIWELCFSDAPPEPSASLQDIYEAGLQMHRGHLVSLLESRFTVDADSLPDFYESYFTQPWSHIYTLNIDDLAVAAGRRFSMRRRVRAISTSSGDASALPMDVDPRHLLVLQLNGSLQDIPDGVTFASRQYSARLSLPDPVYARMAADLMSHAVVFVGTSLDEPSLWQHIEARRTRGQRGTRELRPRSFLVCPELDRPRQLMLRNYNVEWLEMTAAEFAEHVLSQLAEASEEGNSLLAGKREATAVRTEIPDVSAIASNPEEQTEYLLGEEPIWADLQSGRAVMRDCDEALWQLCVEMVSNKRPRGAVLLTGTAGSGKSTSLMRLALRLSADKGCSVSWIDKSDSFSIGAILHHFEHPAGDLPSVIAVDDADLFGRQLSVLTRDLLHSEGQPIILLAVRSGRVDSVINQAFLEDSPPAEITMPPLTDSDIDDLLDVLERENRLGQLLGRSKGEKRHAFTQLSGRLLLVAMIEATSELKFQDKVLDEYDQLDDSTGIAYAIIGAATAYRFALSRDEVLLATGDPSNAMLNNIDSLLRRRLVLESDGYLRARHRRIGEILVDQLQRSGQLEQVLECLYFVAASKVAPSVGRHARARKLMRFLLNHEFLVRAVTIDGARRLYGSVEGLLQWDYHFWLQRGSLEVQHHGHLGQAENFLGQARALAPDDPYVVHEWAYLLFSLNYS